MAQEQRRAQESAATQKTGTSLYKKDYYSYFNLWRHIYPEPPVFVWEIHRDMQVTIKQEQELTEENHELTDKKSKLIDPDELINRARKQFGLVKPGEIPYKQ